jgi:alpha-beta hydrolase superfamily lysophospholipase
VLSFDGTRVFYDVYSRLSRSLVLVVPGFWRDRRHPAMLGLAQRLVSAGYSTAVCDVRGHGDSEGLYGFNWNEHHDVAAIAADLLAHSAAEQLTLIGFSYGGAIAISTAARHDLPISSLVLISPVADFSMIAPRINPLTMHRHIAFAQALKRPRFDWHFLTSAKIRAIDDIGDVHVPLALIHVKDDWLIDHSHSQALYDRANEPKELHLLDIPGNYHADRILSVAADDIEPALRAFLQRYSPL